MKIYEKITDLIGNTPLVWLKDSPNGTRIALKLEYMNPSGSVKDRAAFSMLSRAIGKGKVNQDTVIIEPTSGNTGIALAMCCAQMGLKLILTMPESMSIERRLILKAYGAELVLTPKEKGMQGAVDEAERLLQENENSFMPSQFENPDNPLAHELTTAKEIYDDTEGTVDIVIAGFGTGGTASGVAKGLKHLNPNIKVIGIEPFESPLISQGTAAPHKIQGIGANFKPKNLDLGLIDEIATVRAEDAAKEARKLAKTQGILCGISSGANLKAAFEIASRKENQGKLIVTIICDSGERYLSTELFNES